MVVHSCNSRTPKPCISQAFPPACQTCGLFFCPEHLKKHDCEKEETWYTAGPALNALRDAVNPGAWTTKEADKEWRKKNR